MTDTRDHFRRAYNANALDVQSALQALRFWFSRDCLSYSQLQILNSWLIKLAQISPRLFKEEAKRYALLELRALAAISEKRISTILPHQRALALTTAARAYAVGSITRIEAIDIEAYIKNALRLVDKIRYEADQPQGLRKLVLVYMYAGMIMLRLYEYEQDPEKEKQAQRCLHAVVYFELALNLAAGEADAPAHIAALENLLGDPRLVLAREKYFSYSA